MPADPTTLVIGAGDIWTAPAGTALPADRTIALANAFVRTGPTVGGIRVVDTPSAVEAQQDGESRPVASAITGHDTHITGTTNAITAEKLARLSNATSETAAGEGVLSAAGNGLRDTFVVVVEFPWRDGTTARMVVPRAEFVGNTELGMSEDGFMEISIDLRVLASGIEDVPDWRILHEEIV